MRGGNTSLSVVSIPNFFYTRNLIPVETFKNSPKNNYFKEKTLYKQFKDVNVSRNPRNDQNKFENYNKTKYVPLNKISKLIYDFKDNPEVNHSKDDNKLNLKILQEKAINKKNEDIVYNNDELKKQFTTKIIELLGSINKGDPKVKIVNPIVKNETYENLVKPNVAITSKLDYNDIKSIVKIDFHHDKNANSVKIFERSIDNKFNIKLKP